ncbi:hypothetical protein GCM10027167_41530 [Nocardia heshunensis]
MHGHSILTGTTIVYSPYLIHHRRDLYPDPDRFDSDRWTPERATAPARAALIPFAGGPRKCIGDTFAMTEATLALATIASRWRLKALPGNNVRTALATELRPRSLRLRAVTRA